MVERLGVTIHEGTTVKAVRSGQVITDGGTVSAEIVVCATEGHTRDLAGRRHTIAPFYPQMVATEPLPAEARDEIGLAERPTFADGRNMTIYGQRTADGRLAFSGRRPSYRFGSRIDPGTERSSVVHDHIVAALVGLFSVLGDAPITHRWGGVPGIPRDWLP